MVGGGGGEVCKLWELYWFWIFFGVGSFSSFDSCLVVQPLKIGARFAAFMLKIMPA